MRVAGPGDAASNALGVLWGKSDAGGVPNLLLQHLLDTAAIAELLWDRYLAECARRKLDACCCGHGRLLFALLCALHDVGKASPAFQSKDPDLAQRVQRVGLTWRPLGRAGRGWHHTSAGVVIVRRVLIKAGWSEDQVAWIWPLVLGHHGAIRRFCEPVEPESQGRGRWEEVQDRLVATVVAELGFDLIGWAPHAVPGRADQLALCGGIIMADWLASDARNFPGVDTLDDVSWDNARRRAEVAWSRVGLRGGWSRQRLGVHPDPIAARFGRTARPIQAQAVRLAESVAESGLMIVEAPMGEGKTEAALAAAEVLARRFGADGVFVGMPTQATSDPMYVRVKEWAASIDPQVPVALLHGKREFNKAWRALRQQVSFRSVTGVDEYGCEDPYGSRDHTDDHEHNANSFPAEWFLGRKRGLLTPVAVGTVDQLLYAATRTRHVMLRYTGLAGRVVILDEVHAYDVYMSQFLFEALRWLGDAGVPVVLLSATLPPAVRADLIRAYLQGRLADRDVDVSGLPAAVGYPSVLTACALDGVPRFEQGTGSTWRSSLPVDVEVLDEEPGDGAEAVVGLLRETLHDGGCALVVRNTVGRAQRTFQAVREEFGADAVLLHARLITGDRVDRAERILDLLGPPGRPDAPSRPPRLVVVATQVAEQSFDIDVDLLVSDLAPIDLLLQRIGRVHRHTRSTADRPPRVLRPRVVVTGMARRTEAPPVFPPGTRRVYGTHLLLRTAALVLEAAGDGGWQVPAQVPELVARGYSEGDAPVPSGWLATASQARNEWRADQQRRQVDAEQFLLAGEEEIGQQTLRNLHERSTHDDNDEDVRTVVRDGDPSVEVVLVRHDGREYLTWDGRSLGVNGEAVSDDAVMERVMRSTLRLPARPELTAAAEQELRPLAGWGTDEPWLRHARALVLDDRLSASLGGYQLTYDPELGLLDQRIRR